MASLTTTTAAEWRNNNNNNKSTRSSNEPEGRDFVDMSTRNVSGYLPESEIISALTTEKCKDLLKVYGVQGVEYVITEEPRICRNFIKKTYDVKKESDEMNAGNIQKKSSSSLSTQLGCFAYGYAGIEANAEIKDSKNSTKRHFRSKKKTNKVAMTVIACEIAHFDCSTIRLQSETMKMVEEIGRTVSKIDQEGMAHEFLSKYPAEEIIYTSFAIGGWFSHRCNEMSDEESNEMREMKSGSLQAKGNVKTKITDGAANRLDNAVNCEKNKSNEVLEESRTRTSLVERYKNITYAGPLADSEMGILDGCLSNTNNWAVFPTLTGQQHNTKSVVEIILETANELEGNGRKNLESAAHVIRKVIEDRQLEANVINKKHKDNKIRSMDSFTLFTEKDRYLGKPIFRPQCLLSNGKIFVERSPNVNEKHRIYKFNGKKGDPISHGDIVLVQLGCSKYYGQNFLCRRRTRPEFLRYRNLTEDLYEETYRFCWVIEGMDDKLVSYKHRICLRAINIKDFKNAIGTEMKKKKTELNEEKNKLRKTFDDPVGKQEYYICTTISSEVKLFSEESFPCLVYYKGWNVMKVE